MKIIIPVAGVGSRLAPHTHTVPKALVQVAGKPMIAHILDKIKDIEVSEVVFVVGYLGDQIIEYVSENYSFDVKFIVQRERKGLGHAIYVAMQKFENLDEDMMIILGDTLFEMDINSVIKNNIDGVLVTSKVDNPDRFGVVVKDDAGNIKELVEKPEEFVSDRAIIGIYYIKAAKALYENLNIIIDEDIKTRGEYQLTDALQLMLKKGLLFEDVLCDKWLDCGKPETLLETNRVLLDIYYKGIKYNYKNTVIIEPVSISEDVEIENSVLGPYVSVAKGAKIKNSIIRNSIINKQAYIKNAVMESSLVGESAFYKPAVNRINIGDSSEFSS